MAAVVQEYQHPFAGGEADTVRALLHDLRQPLAAILLLSQSEGGDVSRKFDVIAGQAKWLAELVETSVGGGAATDEWSTAQTASGLGAQVAWWRGYYHFVRPHHALRQTLPVPHGRGGRRAPRRYRPRTPAMAAGLTHRRWSTRELLGVPGRLGT
jgi:hypothetical protein